MSAVILLLFYVLFFFFIYKLAKGRKFKNMNRMLSADKRARIDQIRTENRQNEAPDLSETGKIVDTTKVTGTINPRTRFNDKTARPARINMVPNGRFNIRDFEDRNNDWLARQIREENRLAVMGLSEMNKLKTQHEQIHNTLNKT